MRLICNPGMEDNNSLKDRLNFKAITGTIEQEESV